MKRLLLPLLASLALPIAVNAETWILLQSFSGYTRSIDASSVVKNGSWRYANVRFKGPYGRPEGSINGFRVNCKKEIVFFPSIIFKRKSKNEWVLIKKSISGEEYEKPTNMGEGSEGLLSEFIYQFLCKEWE